MVGDDIDGIFGYYGHGNFGDELFERIIVDKANGMGLIPATVCSETDDLRDKYGREQNLIHRGKLLIANICLLKKSRSITLGGGSVIGHLNPMSLRHMQILKSNLCNIPFLGLGVGIQSATGNVSSRLLKSFDWIAVRSAKDYRIAKEVIEKDRLCWMPDMAYADNELFEEQIPSPRTFCTIIPTTNGVLGKCVSKDPDTIKRWARKELFQFCEQHDLEIKILLAQYGKVDIAIAAKLIHIFTTLGFKTTKFCIHQTLEKTVADLRSSRVVLTDRFHGAVVSHRLGIPFFLTGDQSKNQQFNLEIMGGGVFSIYDLPSRETLETILELQTRSGYADRINQLRMQANEAIENWGEILKVRLG